MPETSTTSNFTYAEKVKEFCNDIAENVPSEHGRTKAIALLLSEININLALIAEVLVRRL